MDNIKELLLTHIEYQKKELEYLKEIVKKHEDNFQKLYVKVGGMSSVIGILTYILLKGVGI